MKRGNGRHHGLALYGDRVDTCIDPSENAAPPTKTISTRKNPKLSLNAKVCRCPLINHWLKLAPRGKKRNSSPVLLENVAAVATDVEKFLKKMLAKGDSGRRGQGCSPFQSQHCAAGTGKRRPRHGGRPGSSVWLLAARQETSSAAGSSSSSNRKSQFNACKLQLPTPRPRAPPTRRVVKSYICVNDDDG